MIENKEQLKTHRKSLNLTQKEFGEKYGASEITIRRLETGVTPINKSYTIRLINMSLETRAYRKVKKFFKK